MKKILFFLIATTLIGACSTYNKEVNHKADKNDTISDKSKKSEVIIKNDMEFFALAKKKYMPISFTNGGSNGYFYNSLDDDQYPLLEEENIINKIEKKDILSILKKYYSNKHDLSQYFFNNMISNYRMYGLIQVYKKEFLSKLIYYEGLTQEGRHINILFMINMNSEMDRNLNNIILAINIGGEAGSPYVVQLSSDLKLDFKNNIIVNQTYQVDDSTEILENTKRTILINTCSDCKGDSKSLVTYK
jgi:hypothetical protein